MRASTLIRIVGPLVLAANLAQAQTAPPPLRLRLATQDISVNPDGSFVNLNHLELQVLTAAVATQAMQQRVSYDGTLEDVEVVEAFTIKPNGQKIAVDPSAILSQQAPAANTLTPVYTDQRQKVIVFPAVEAGDTLSFTFKRTQKQPSWPGQYFFGSGYNSVAAIDEARLTVKAPKTMPLSIDASGMEVKKTDEGDQTVYSWSYAHPTPEAAKANVVSDLNARPHVYLSSFKSYDDFSRSYAAMIAAKIAVTPKIQAQADLLTSGIGDKRAQAEAIYDWVAQRVRYVAIDFGTGGFIPHDPDWVLNNMYGDCKDHAALFASLLKAKGISADLVLINATNEYGIPKIPETAFNHMIVWLPEFKLYADTTSSTAAFGSLPLAEYGKPVVLIAASGPSQAQIPLLGKGDLSVAYKVTETMDQTGRLDVTAVTTATGPMAASLRRIGTAIQAIGPEKFAGDVLGKAGMPRATGSFTISPVSLTDQYQLTGTFKTGNAVANQFFWSTANVLRALAAPGDSLMGPLSNSVSSNVNNVVNTIKLTDTDATPCYSGKVTDDISLEMLPGKQMIAIPADASIKTSHLQYTTHWTHAGSTITVHREFVSDMDQALCSGALRKETADALVRIKADFDIPLTLVPGNSGASAAGGGAGTTVSFAADDTKVAPAGPDSAGLSPTVQSALATAADAPHIDAITLSEGMRDGIPSVIQQISYHAPKGNAVTMHFEIISISKPAPDFSAGDTRIGAPAERQQAGTFATINSGCGRFPSPYSVVKRAVLIDADGKRSNAVDYSIKCNGAAASAASFQ